MTNIIQNWNGTIEVNGNVIDKTFDFTQVNGGLKLVFKPKSATTENREISDNKVQGVSGTYRITVKKYMTEKATPQFDFMEKFNNNIPMPLMTMVGDKIKETRGMVYMKLHGDITATVTERCLRCGKPITNKISRYFGMGPVCGGHNYVSPFETEEELKAAVGEYRKKLQQIEWEGWVIRSSIVEEEELC